MITSYISVVTTDLSWNDLLLDKETLKQVEEIKTWIKHSLSGNLYTREKKLNPGFRCLFYGSPRSGKTLTAALIGKEFNKTVSKIDLSKLVSKYIGETEKNLAAIFNDAEKTGSILFFDEADALFHKHTDVKDAHDKYSNQEISYLLQQIENYKGLIILSTNKKANIDEAFTRRLRSVIHFPTPDPGF